MDDAPPPPPRSRSRGRGVFFWLVTLGVAAAVLWGLHHVNTLLTPRPDHLPSARAERMEHAYRQGRVPAHFTERSKRKEGRIITADQPCVEEELETSTAFTYIVDYPRFAQDGRAASREPFYLGFIFEFEAGSTYPVNFYQTQYDEQGSGGGGGGSTGYRIGSQTSEERVGSWEGLRLRTEATLPDGRRAIVIVLHEKPRDDAPWPSLDTVRSALATDPVEEIRANPRILKGFVFRLPTTPIPAPSPPPPDGTPSSEEAPS